MVDKFDINCCRNILILMKKEIQEGRYITEQMVDTAIKFLYEGASFHLEEYGYDKEKHKQGFIV